MISVRGKPLWKIYIYRIYYEMVKEREELTGLDNLRCEPFQISIERFSDKLSNSNWENETTCSKGVAFVCIRLN